MLRRVCIVPIADIVNIDEHSAAVMCVFMYTVLCVACLQALAQQRACGS